MNFVIVCKASELLEKLKELANPEIKLVLKWELLSINSILILSKRKENVNMDLQDRYNELDEIVMRLDSLIDEITDKDYIEMLQDIMYRAKEELNELEPKLAEQYESEERELEREYWREAIWLHLKI